MELSLKCEYAILALLELASHFAAAQPLQSRQIASQRNIPDRYLEHLLATLRRNGLLRSQRGSRGGYLLAREPWSISILDIIRCIEGSDTSSTANAQKSNLDTEAISVVQELWQASQKAATDVLGKCTLKDLYEQEKQRQLSTTMYYI
ncbi:MAG: Rrf2 family transcriptional regulator [Pseudanabaena sp. RU_4_16]|nr:Rrf2 family transcriptional regulator [Pseudanabaena sp. RU_4_16]NKB17742.1 Rrf2 family transcriptional regulator [Pseudanabaena sp. CRU_2_10]